MSEEELNKMFSEQASARTSMISEWPDGLKIKDAFFHKEMNERLKGERMKDLRFMLPGNMMLHVDKSYTFCIKKCISNLLHDAINMKTPEYIDMEMDISYVKNLRDFINECYDELKIVEENGERQKILDSDDKYENEMVYWNGSNIAPKKGYPKYPKNWSDVVKEPESEE